MSTVNQDELKAITVLKLTGKESEWDQMSETFVALARARAFAGILLGTEQTPRADKEIDRKKADGSHKLTEAQRKENKILRQANGNAYINLHLSCEELPYDLVSMAKPEELPDGCTRDARERLTSAYDLTEGEEKITLLSMFQQNQLEDVTTNITVSLTSLAIQVNKLLEAAKSLFYCALLKYHKYLQHKFLLLTFDIFTSEPLSQTELFSNYEFFM